MSRSPNDPETNSAGFVGRWSRLKQQQTESPLPSGDLPVVPDESVDVDGNATGVLTPGRNNDSDPALTPALTEASTPASGEDTEQTVVLTDEDMPPLETLDADSDYSPFFSEGVSKQLRNLALKKLFFSGKFASRDGLDDYDDDFTRFEPLGDTITSDMKFHERRKEKARLAKLQEEEEHRRLASQEETPDGEEADADPETQIDDEPDRVATTESEMNSESEREESQDTASDASPETAQEASSYAGGDTGLMHPDAGGKA